MEADDFAFAAVVALGVALVVVPGSYFAVTALFDAVGGGPVAPAPDDRVEGADVTADRPDRSTDASATESPEATPETVTPATDVAGDDGSGEADREPGTSISEPESGPTPAGGESESAREASEDAPPVDRGRDSQGPPPDDAGPPEHANAGGNGEGNGGEGGKEDEDEEEDEDDE